MTAASVMTIISTIAEPSIGFRAQPIMTALGEAKTAVRHAKGEVAQLQAVRSQAETILRIGDDGSDPIGSFSEFCIEVVGLDTDAVQRMLALAAIDATEPGKIDRPLRSLRLEEKANGIGQNRALPLTENLSGRPTPPLRSLRSDWRDGISTAALLRTKTFQPIKFIVPNLITEGVNLLVSRPKLGKSWLALDVCLAASGDGYTLGNLKPMQGDVLYLALEDSERRLQGRIDRLLGAFRDWPARLHIKTRWRRIDDGGIDDLKEWCDSVTEPVLIVIDVFAKIRPAHSKSKMLYEADYEAIGALQEFATDKKVAVVLVHHDRKMEAEDPFDTVSGSHGLTGAADTIIILKRTTNGVTLHARGRDIEEQELAIQFNRDNCKWAILGTAQEIKRSDERTRIIEALKKANGPMSVKAIMAAADMPKRNNLEFLLSKMLLEGEIERVGRGEYALPKTTTDES